MSYLIMTLGPRTAAQLGLILPHEHVFVDLRTPDQPGGGTPLPCTHLSERFLGALEGADVDGAAITQLTHANPYRAFAR